MLKHLFRPFIVLSLMLAAFVAPAIAAQEGPPLYVLGHLRAAPDPTTGVTAPVLTSCGTGAALAAGSTDFAGTVTTGSGGTTCTITFGKTYTVAPTCIMSAVTVAGLPAFTTSATAITATTTVASTAYHYICVGKGSGS